MNRKTNRAGFTLVEVLLATVISVMVFAALGMVLTKCFSLWKDATANWRLSQYARISRERILCGVTNSVFGNATNQTGLLSATNAIVTLDSGWNYVGYGRADEPSVLYQIRGWPETSDDKHLQLRKASSPWAYGLSTGGAEPGVRVDSFIASMSNDMMTITYRLRLSAAGKTFTQPHTIRACLINKE